MAVTAYREDIPKKVLDYMDKNNIQTKRPAFDPYGAVKGAVGGGVLGEIARNFGFEGFTWEKESSSSTTTTSSSGGSSKTTSKLSEKRLSKLIEGGGESSSDEINEATDANSSHTEGGGSSTSSQKKMVIPNIFGKIRAEILAGGILGGFWKPMGLNLGSGGGAGMTMDDVIAQMKSQEAAETIAKAEREQKIADNKAAAAERKEQEAKELRLAALEQSKEDAANRKDAKEFTRNIILGVLAFILLVIAAVKSPFA